MQIRGSRYCLLQDCVHVQGFKKEKTSPFCIEATYFLAHKIFTCKIPASHIELITTIYEKIFKKKDFGRGSGVKKKIDVLKGTAEYIFMMPHLALFGI